MFSFLGFSVDKVGDLSFLLKALSYRERVLQRSLAARLYAKVDKNKEEFFSAWNSCLHHVTSLALAHIHRVTEMSRSGKEDSSQQSCSHADTCWWTTLTKTLQNTSPSSLAVCCGFALLFWITVLLHNQIRFQLEVRHVNSSQAVFAALVPVTLEQFVLAVQECQVNDDHRLLTKDPHRTTTEQVVCGWWIILSTAVTLTW
ncbi:hypothetical protein NFI96_003381 [Prochilodus magdalenae]|nr:hypothetical protein NFI96_003381 [Prochilodus magdalenae]